MGVCASCRREGKVPVKRTTEGLGRGRGKATAELLPRRSAVLAAMANSISNIKMTNPLKNMVSKRRKRYIKDGFNLDLAYITDKLIAMGFPAEKLEGVYRNHIDEVYRFLELKHKDHYRIYNLCSERSYDPSKFHDRVVKYAFDDHSPPMIELIQCFCEDVHKWLQADPKNVAVVHCKAGKGRTGTMVCCYLLFSGQKQNADEALKYYGTKRTHDEKGVTIPSQRRYVEYYGWLVRGMRGAVAVAGGGTYHPTPVLRAGAAVAGGVKYHPAPLHLREVLLRQPPSDLANVELTLVQHSPPFKAPTECYEVRKNELLIRLPLNHCTPLSGDVKVELFAKTRIRKDKLFHFWINTFFVVNQVGAVRIPAPSDSSNLETYRITLHKWQLDDAHKDKQNKLSPAGFKVEVIFQRQPPLSFPGTRAPPSPPSPRTPPSPPSPPSPDTSTSGSEHWDSDRRMRLTSREISSALARARDGQRLT